MGHLCFIWDPKEEDPSPPSAAPRVSMRIVGSPDVTLLWQRGAIRRVTFSNDGSARLESCAPDFPFLCSLLEPARAEEEDGTDEERGGARGCCGGVASSELGRRLGRRPPLRPHSPPGPRPQRSLMLDPFARGAPAIVLLDTQLAPVLLRSGRRGSGAGWRPEQIAASAVRRTQAGKWVVVPPLDREPFGWDCLAAGAPPLGEALRSVANLLEDLRWDAGGVVVLAQAGHEYDFPALAAAAAEAGIVLFGGEAAEGTLVLGDSRRLFSEGVHDALGGRYSLRDIHDARFGASQPFASGTQRGAAVNVEAMVRIFLDVAQREPTALEGHLAALRRSGGRKLQRLRQRLLREGFARRQEADAAAGSSGGRSWLGCLRRERPGLAASWCSGLLVARVSGSRRGRRSFFLVPRLSCSVAFFFVAVSSGGMIIATLPPPPPAAGGFFRCAATSYDAPPLALLQQRFPRTRTHLNTNR